MRELSVDAKNSKNQQHKENIGLDDAGKKFLAGRKFKRSARRIFQGELCLGSVKSLDRPAVPLTYQFIRRTHDQIDHFPVQGFLLRVSAAFRDGLLRERRVASASLRETPQERRGIVIDLLSKCVINLHGQKSTNGHDRSSRTRMRPRRHRGNICGKKNVKTRRGASPARRRNVHGDRHWRSEDVLNHVLHRSTEPARSVHGDQNKSRVTASRVGKSLINVGGQDGVNYALKPQFKNERTGRLLVRGNRRHEQENCASTQDAEKEGGRNQFGSLGVKGALHLMEAITHCTPPPGFFSAGLEFCKCSSSCLASV